MKIMRILLVIAYVASVCIVGCSTKSQTAEQNSVKNQSVKTTPVKSQMAEQYSVKLSDVPEVLQQLKQRGSNGSFAVFMFSNQRKSGNENIVNLQFSIENGKIGLDWVLLAPANIRDERRVTDFLTARKAPPRRVTANDVNYLRAESGDLVLIGQDIMREIYGMKDNDDIEFLPEGFEWKQSRAQR
jgi:hypothetical protein